jgi:branched-chain amino acid transport system ATP-binding protein
MALFEVRGLTHFFGGLRALHDFNLCLEGGELVGLIGPNGAGKTTVFNLVSGIYRPREGEVRMQGRDLVGLRPHDVAAQGIARTFQNIRLWSNMTVLDNVRLAHHHDLGYGIADALLRTSRYRRAEARIESRALDLMVLMGLQEHVQETAKNLPYGLQRKVEMARALMVQPKLLILDEPAAGMNPRETQGLMDLIRKVRAEFNLTIWLIEHEMRVVMNLCEFIQVLDFGETIAQGSPQEIKGNPRVVEAYLGKEEA